MHLNTSYLVLSTLNVFKCAHFGSLQCDLKISWWHILEILEPKKKKYFLAIGYCMYFLVFRLYWYLWIFFQWDKNEMMG